MKTQPFSPAEKLLKWTKFALENGGLPELVTEGRYLSFVVLHNLDIFIPFGVLVAALFLLLVYGVFMIVRALTRSSEKQKKA